MPGQTVGMQNPTSVIMIRPEAFAVNAETAIDNSFQARSGAEGDLEAALAEFDAMKNQLSTAGVRVLSFAQERDDTPDAVFPNNWFSTHESGLVVTYPMFAPSRRKERRQDILEAMATMHKVSGVMDLSGNEVDAKFLEGTGAIVFDHTKRIAFMAQSLRADADLLIELCGSLGYEPAIFTAVDGDGYPIYHTNVMMSVGEKVSLVGFDTAADPDEQKMLRDEFAASTNLVIELSSEQIASFAGNALEVQGADGPVLVISETGWNALRPAQRTLIEAELTVLTPDLKTIEKSGGSARCMMAGVHLPLRPMI